MRAAAILLAGALGTPAAAAQLPPRTVPWSGTALPTVLATPGRITEIRLEPGERLAGPGPVAAGDTARWIIGHSESGAGAAATVHVLVKPTEPGLATNLLISTDRRSYQLVLRSTAADWIPWIAFRHPPGEPSLASGGGPVSARETRDPPPASGANLSFAWRVEGRAPFRPERVFDDGRHVFIDIPLIAGRVVAPPLFMVGPDGREAAAEVRIERQRMVVPRLFDEAELRLGRRRVRILRGGGQ